MTSLPTYVLCGRICPPNFTIHDERDWLLSISAPPLLLLLLPVPPRKEENAAQKDRRRKENAARAAVQQPQDRHRRFVRRPSLLLRRSPSAGLPNVGKSSFFNVLSETDLGKAANFPYATINPEEARIPVPDPRFDWLYTVYKPASRIPAFLTCIDIAGLTAGASTGAGLGNSFLSHVRSVDGIFQVVRAFDDAEVIHVEGDVDPLRDMDIIQTELRLKDIEWVEKHLDTLKKTGRNLGSSSLADKAKKEEIAIVEKVLKTITVDAKDVRKVDWNNKEVDVINTLQLLTAKPVTYLVNLSEKDYIRKKNKWLPKIKAWIDEHNTGDPLIPFSVALEERLAHLSPEEKKAEEEKIGAVSGLPKITQAGYASLDVRHLFSKYSTPDILTAHPLLYLRPRRGPRVDHPQGHQGAPGRRRHPLGL